jgi:hypothetical protein
MGCCKSSESTEDVVRTQSGREQSLLVAEHGSASPQSNPIACAATEPPPPASAPAPSAPPAAPERNSSPLSVESAESPAGAQRVSPVPVPFASSPVPLSSSSPPGTAGRAASAAQAMAMSPSDSNSVTSWEGEAGAGIWRVCDADLSPHVLNGILEDEAEAEESEARQAAAALSHQSEQGDSPFGRSVASVTTPLTKDSHIQKLSAQKGPSPNVLSNIMKQKAANDGNIARNPMLGNQDMSPMDGGGSLWGRSVSSVSGGGTPMDGTDKDGGWYKNQQPVALGFDVDEEWRGADSKDGVENLPPTTSLVA